MQSSCYRPSNHNSSPFTGSHIGITWTYASVNLSRDLAAALQLCPSVAATRPGRLVAEPWTKTNTHADNFKKKNRGVMQKVVFWRQALPTMRRNQKWSWVVPKWSQINFGLCIPPASPCEGPPGCETTQTGCGITPIGCRGGSRYVEGWWGFPLLENKKVYFVPSLCLLFVVVLCFV